MSQNPVLFPGAALSRNSVMRNSAVQASAYVSMDQSLARLPVTCDEALVTAGANPLTANKARFARLKIRDNAEHTAGAIWSKQGSNTGSAVNVGHALYEYRPQINGFDLVLVSGSFLPVNNSLTLSTSGWAVTQITPTVPIDRTKAYVIGIVNESPSSFSSALIFSLDPTLASSAASCAQTLADVTVATGWPKVLKHRGLVGVPGMQSDFQFGQVANIFAVVSDSQSSIKDLYGTIY